MKTILICALIVLCIGCQSTEKQENKKARNYKALQCNVDTFKNLKPQTDRDSYKYLAQNGCEQVYYNLGIMFKDGIGGHKDIEQSIKWLTMAIEKNDFKSELFPKMPSEKNNSDAQVHLGLIYENPRYFNKEKALKLFSESAAQCNLFALNKLGSLYRDGHLVPRNYSTAHLKFLHAATRGYTAAMINLSYMNAQGEYVKKDYERAYWWASIAEYFGENTKKLKRSYSRYLSNSTIIKNDKSALEQSIKIKTGNTHKLYCML